MTEQHSYSRILKSSSLIGGAQGIAMLVGMVRVKFVAMLIGPVGLGMVVSYQAVVQLIGAISGLGLQASAVRDVAEASENQDEMQLGRTILTLRRLCWLTGGLGSLAVVLFSGKLSQMTFGSRDYAFELSLVGLTVLFSNVKNGQTAVIRGMRRIADLAKLNVIGVVWGSVICVALYAWLGMRGIVPAIVSLMFVQLVASWWYARKIPVPQIDMSWKESFREGGGMLKLGLAFMWSAILVSGVAYAARVLISHEINLAAVGIYSAAFSLSAMMVNFILQAMGADYYPSLTAVNSDHARMRELVNQQTQVGLLLGFPGLLGLLAFAPWAIKIFYTSEFEQAADLLQWFVLGCLGQIISWPIGFIVLAKGAARLFAVIQTVFNLFHIVAIWGLLCFAGIQGVAVAFFAMYVLSISVLLIVTKHLIGFSWNLGVWKLLRVILPVTSIVFISVKSLPVVPATVLGLAATGGSAIFCLRGLVVRLAPDHKICRLVSTVPGLNLVVINRGSVNHED